MVQPFQVNFFSQLLRLRRSIPQTPLLQSGLGSSAFARHYLRNHILFSLPEGT